MQAHPSSGAARPDARVAQLVEHATENRSVGGSIPSPGTTFSRLPPVYSNAPEMAQFRPRTVGCSLAFEQLPGNANLRASARFRPRVSTANSHEAWRR
jgi:hypothetical protein